MYSGHRVDFRKYAVSCFNPYLFADKMLLRAGCGATALALLTGVPPEKILALNNCYHYSDEFVVRFLRERQYDVLPLTQCLVSATTSEIGPRHLLLVSQLFQKNEGTWGVIFNGVYYHNFVGYYLDWLSFLNKPILSAYLVWHPRWCPWHLEGAAPVAKSDVRPAGFTLKDLGVVTRLAERASPAQPNSLPTQERRTTRHRASLPQRPNVAASAQTGNNG